MSKRWQVLTAGLILLLVLMGATGLLGIRGLVTASTAMELEHRRLADQLFDEVERELSILVDQEEARSFLEYRYAFVPPLMGTDGLVCSPLASPPTQEGFVGYFQVDPDGAVFLPTEPREASLQGACGDGISPEQAERIRTVVGGIDFQQSKTSPAGAWPPVEPTLSLSNSVSYSRRRTPKQNRSVATKMSQAANYAPQAQLMPAPSKPLDEVDVMVSPLVGTGVEGNQLALHRTVHLGGETFRQGLVVDPGQLGSSITQRVLTVPHLADSIVLSWSPDQRQDRQYRFQRTLAPPFDVIELTADIDRIPGVSTGGRGTMLGLWAVSMLITLVGGTLVFQVVSTELELADRRSNFVSAVTHELKTPLTSIRMYSEMLQQGMVEPDKQQHYFGVITNESERLTRLINNVLTFGRIERNDFAAELGAVDLGAVLDQLQVIAGPALAEAGFTLEVEVEALAVQGNQDLMLQVLLNLVDNSIKFVGDGRRVVQIRSQQQDGWAVVTVRDHGPGVPTRQLREIFDPFFRGERELVRKTSGTGIGLALVKGLVEAMGGRVTAKNREPGLVVEITLKMA